MFNSSFHKVCSNLCHNRCEQGKHAVRFEPLSVPSAVIHMHWAQLCNLPSTKHDFVSLLFLASLVAERKDLIFDQAFPSAGLDPVDGL